MNDFSRHPPKKSMTGHDGLHNPILLFCGLVLISFLNYTDRAILPGSANEFIQFISTTLATSRPDIYLGFLQSSFIIGFSFASIIISHLVHFQGPFYICAVGLGIWIISALLSGMGFYLDSFVILLIGRMLSGAGEASFICTVPPWIAKHAPSDEKGKWLAIFYTALPVGTAFGYWYAAFVASKLGVHWAFFMETFAMLPLIAVLLRYAPMYPSSSSNSVEQVEEREMLHLSSDLIYSSPDVPASRVFVNPLHEVPKIVDVESQSTEPAVAVAVKQSDATMRVSGHEVAPTMLEELHVVLKSPVYLLITAGIACQAAVLCGLGTFGSAFLMGLGYFDSETAASSTFGIVVCLAGVVGTPLGGLLLDFCVRKNEIESKGSDAVQESAALTSTDDDVAVRNTETKETLQWVTKIITVGTFMGCLFLCAVYAVHNRVLFLLMVTMGCLLVFLCNPCVNIGIMMAIPEKNRSFAIAMTSVCVHVFGDVPSPIVTGLLKDLLAPGCSPPLIVKGSTSLLSSARLVFMALTGTSSSSECRAEGHGLRLTMLIVSLWLLVSVIFFGVACYYSYAPDLGVTKSPPKNVINPTVPNTDKIDIKEIRKEKIMKKAFQSKRARARQPLQQPLLCVEEDVI